MRRNVFLFVVTLFTVPVSASPARADVVITNLTKVTIKFEFRAAGDPLGFSPVVEIKPNEQTSLNRKGSDIRFHTGAESKTYFLAPGFYDFKETTPGTIDLFRRPR
jgi:hypothetical protein